MFTEAIVAEISMTKTVQRRGVGKAVWKRVIETLLSSEKEDMLDLAVLRRKVNDPELLRVIAQLYERKAIRMAELNDLLHYDDRDKDKRRNGGND